jgi:organic radical activating enzyme
MTKPSLEFLEIMLTSACNLSCHGCTTFSDLKHQGYVPWSQGKSWLEAWIPRLDIQAVGIIGGEPLMNPHIRDYIQGIRDLLPNAQIRMVTNGLLLNKHFDIVDLLDSVGNAVLKISHHVDDSGLNSTIDQIMQYKPWTPVTEFGINRFVSPSGLRFQIARPIQFVKTFKNEYENMMPHNNNPARAFEICVQKRCPMLLDGKIWKCGTLALTPRILQRMGSPNIDSWLPYIDPGLPADCDEKELQEFVDNFGKPNRACAQCPSTDDVESLIDHRSTVIFKNKSYLNKSINYGVDSIGNM